MVNSGTLGDGFHTLTERVYFEHTDFSGVVYHTRYLDFLEHGRSDYVLCGWLPFCKSCFVIEALSEAVLCSAC